MLYIATVSPAELPQTDPLSAQITTSGLTVESNAPDEFGFGTMGDRKKKPGLPPCAPSTSSAWGTGAVG
jgi:hypothetical protein